MSEPIGPHTRSWVMGGMTTANMDVVTKIGRADGVVADIMADGKITTEEWKRGKSAIVALRGASQRASDKAGEYGRAIDGREGAASLEPMVRSGYEVSAIGRQQARILEEPQDLLCQVVGVPRLEEEAGTTLVDEVRDPAHATADHRGA